MLRAIHWKYTMKINEISMNNVQYIVQYITKDASNTILTARAATSARNWACQVKESHGFSTDLHRSPHTHTEHGPWPMALIPEQDCDKRKTWHPWNSLNTCHVDCVLASLFITLVCGIQFYAPMPAKYLHHPSPEKWNQMANQWPNDFMISLVPGGLRFALSTLSTLSTKICHLN